MSALARNISANPVRYAKQTTVTLAVVGALATGIWSIVFAASNWQRGIYAGMHGNDARALVTRTLEQNLGIRATEALRYKGSVKTHLAGIGPQERIYYFVGPRGVRYCASEWQDGEDFVTNIVKGCLFK